jgi:hypothetical protein|tara:strand:- start:635 stop:1054 length:420 start_codon:yes stop_codon:yes gene_type:complete
MSLEVILGVSGGLQALGLIFGGRAARAEQLAKAREMKIQQKINEINAISTENELARNYQATTENILATSVGGESTKALLDQNKTLYQMDQATASRTSLLQREQLKRSEIGFRQSAGMQMTKSLIKLGQVGADTAYKIGS